MLQYVLVFLETKDGRWVFVVSVLLSARRIIIPVIVVYFSSRIRAAYMARCPFSKLRVILALFRVKHSDDFMPS